MVSKAEVKVISFEKLKLWAVEKLKNQSSKSMRACGRKFGVKTRPQIFLAQNLIFFNGSTAFWFPRNSRKSSSTAFRFLQRLSNFFNGFLISSTAFQFLQWLSDFFNGFPISSTAFWFLQRLSHSKLFISWIIWCHSPHSLASVKDMYVEMGFQLNLYQQLLLLVPLP